MHDCLTVYMSLHHTHDVYLFVHRGQKGVWGSQRTAVTEGCKLSSECWELDPGPQDS